jgi:hypothetical protein
LFACSRRDLRAAGVHSWRVRSLDRTRHRYLAGGEAGHTLGPLCCLAAEHYGQPDQYGSDDTPTNQRRTSYAAVVCAERDPSGQAVNGSHLECIDDHEA